MKNSIYFSQEHDLLRDQTRRFVRTEVQPRGERWEQDGMTPRLVLKQLGSLGLLGMRYA